MGTSSAAVYKAVSEAEVVFPEAGGWVVGEADLEAEEEEEEEEWAEAEGVVVEVTGGAEAGDAEETRKTENAGAM